MSGREEKEGRDTTRFVRRKFLNCNCVETYTHTHILDVFRGERKTSVVEALIDEVTGWEHNIKTGRCFNGEDINKTRTLDPKIKSRSQIPCVLFGVSHYSVIYNLDSPKRMRSHE